MTETTSAAYGGLRPNTNCEGTFFRTLSRTPPGDQTLAGNEGIRETFSTIELRNYRLPRWLYEGGDMRLTDFTIVCQGEEVNCHELICGQSPFFEATGLQCFRSMKVSVSLCDMTS